MLVQNSLAMHLILTFIGIICLINQEKVLACRVYPSEYAYRDDSVIRTESPGANCMRYSDMRMEYVHCDVRPVQLKLSDSEIGSKTEYKATYYYEWTAGGAEQQLFIFPTRVSLTTITLHYYGDSDRGRPILRFYAVPDDFDVWDAISLTSGYPYEGVASVPPGGEPAGHRKVSINVNFNTMKVLMCKFSSSFTFAVSEVEFFTCILTSTATPNETISSVSPLVTYTMATSTSDSTAGITANKTKQDTSLATTAILFQKEDSPFTSLIAAGIVGALLLVVIASLITILSLILWHHKRRAHKSEIEPNSAGSMREDASYSILERGTRQQIQPQGSNSIELYDQIHLSPSTGQTELISKTESKTTENINMSTLNVYSSVDTENFQPVPNSEESKVEDATYAVVDKKKKKKKSKATSDDNANQKEKIEEEVEMQEQPSLEEMYAVVHKKPKKIEEQGETPPPIPASTVESLYTAVQKTPQ